jgi:hypothetical protein
MIVHVEDAVFGSSRDRDLFQLFRLAENGRHALQLDPPFEPGADRAVNRWLYELTVAQREEIELELEVGPKASVTGIPSRRAIHIVDAKSAAWTPEPHLPLPEALDLLERPLTLLMENRRYDRGLLLKAAREDQARELETLERRRWLDCDSGGGMGELQSIVEAADPAQKLRTWVMIDSDARWNYEPSADAARCRDKCASHLPSGSVHTLRRRTNENYLPLGALHGWALAKKGGKKTHPAWESFQAYAVMNPEQRHHYPVREGFAKDSKTGVPDGFGTHAQHPALQRGFGEDVKKIWLSEHRLDEDWFRRDESLDELQAIVRSIFEAL